MEQKKVASILITSIFILSTIATVLPFASTADPSEWYTYKQGVMTSDYYLLYPFEELSVDFGLSKFGEMINYPMDTEIGLGLQYPGYDSVATWDQTDDTSRDPFANEYINPWLWLNGWLCDVRYTHRTWRDRRIMTMAMFADMSAYGGDWLVGHGYSTATGHTYDFTSAPHGGRKTTGYAETEELQVLYDGPRRYIALTSTTIYDWEDTDGEEDVDHPDETWPILRVDLTFIFNKVEKEILIYKDIKILISGKELDSPLDVQFSNREEWDLGPPPDYGSYAHFYYQEMETCYGPEWHTAPAIMREFIAEGYGLVNVPMSYDGIWGAPIVPGSVRLYFNGEFMEEGVDYDINYQTGYITTYTFTITSDDYIIVVYKLVKSCTVGTVVYDAGEVVSIEWLGIEHNYDIAQIISSDKEYVGYKAFWPTLSDYTVDGWGVSLSPLIDVDETDIQPAEPEIPFIIGEWDFMLGKEYPIQFRGVEKVGINYWHDATDEDAPGDTTNTLDSEAVYQLDEIFNPWDLDKAVHKKTKREVEFFTWSTDFTTTTLDYDTATLAYTPIDSDWDKYCNFSEKVIHIDYETGAETLFIPTRAAWETSPDYTLTNNQIILTATGLAKMTTNDVLKILYSRVEYHDKVIIFTEGWEDGEELYLGNKPIVEDTVEVFLDGVELTETDDYTVDGATGIITMVAAGTSENELKVVYQLYGGRYEWIVAGENSHVVDSLGVGYAAAAVKNKNREIGLMGMDAYIDTAYSMDPELLVPYVMRYFGTTGLHDWDDYLDDITSSITDPGFRAALKDDWCTTWAVSSSNMISVGGPLANMLSYYGNDFTYAIYGIYDYTPYSPWAGAIAAVSCWSKNAYYSDDDYGYAVIGTTKDKNGTVLLSIYGVRGRDTYYAAKWFHDEIHCLLQTLKPHITDLILRIDYEDPEHPVVEIMSVLGSISETSCTGLAGHPWVSACYQDVVDWEGNTWHSSLFGSDWVSGPGWPNQQVPHPDP